mmetsp:Transcript_5714/g.14512  ORF Transcript_5714/g.14512 Transcript_5714/m.14512 type:complete len:439 (-) Transcript_5714:41-1357(-)
MSALVETQRAAGGDAISEGISALEREDNNFPDAPLSPATDYDDENEEPLSPCGSDNGLLASSEGEIRVGPSVTRPTAVEPTSTPPPPILTDLDAPTCVICLEALDDSSDNPGVAVPCACQRNLDQPTRVHESCLRTWVGACAQRAARRGSDDQPANAFAARRAAARRARSLENQADVQQNNVTAEPSSPPSPPSSTTCPLCRAPLSEASVLGLLLPVRARTALETDPALFCATPLAEDAPPLRCVVSVLDRKSGRARGAPLLALRVQGHGGRDALLVARASSRASSGRMASKYEVLQADAVLATLTRNVLGTRWTVKSGDVRTHVDYAVNRLANRPRAMRVRRGSINLRSRAPEYNPRLQGFCLDFFGRARLASVRNFQLVDADAPAVPNDPHAEQKCKLLFGRWSADSFHLDVKHPFSPAEAFAVAVSSFATKLATI